MQKPIEGRSVLAFSTTKSMLKNRHQPTSKNSTLFKREGVAVLSTTNDKPTANTIL
jgi:hypothetical protein